MFDGVSRPRRRGDRTATRHSPQLLLSSLRFRHCRRSHLLLLPPHHIPRRSPISSASTSAPATFYSGHHTVYQHAHFEFGLENVSRQFVWSFLHAHPFYNSEQQSQRYVRLDRAQAYIPPVSLFFDEGSRRIYEAAIARAWAYYRELSALLVSDARDNPERHLAYRPDVSSQAPPKIERSAEKRAIEIARYVLPASPPSPRWCTPSPGSCFTASGACVLLPTRPAKPAPSSAKWWRWFARLDPQFFDRFGTAPLEELPEWKDAAPNEIACR